MTCANHPDRERVAFCQNCGKPLCVECSRVVGQAVFCEPCLAARLAGATAPPMGAGSYSYSGTSSGVNYSMSGTIPPPSAPGEPNPGLAALLGFIPGVGAFYNGQYAKGVVHLIVFAVLISLADQHGIFGLFIAGWVFYQVIEAHHTARARRDGTPLPNPFGLNDLSERLGFGRSWPSPTSTGNSGYGAPPSPGAGGSYPPPPAASAYTAGTAQAPYGAPVAGSAWGAPEEIYTAPGQPPFAAGQPYAPAGQPYTAVPPADPYGAPPPPDSLQPTSGRKLPTGAFVLIGLGAFFLLANTGHFGAFAIQWIVPFLLIGFGVWIFVRRMTNTGLSFTDDGSPGYRLRLYSALRSAIWLIVIGLLLFLDITRILTWSHSWPLLIVLAGVIALLRRAAYTAVPLAPFPGMPTSPMGTPAAAAAPRTATSIIVPADTPKTDDTLGDRS